MFDDCHGFSQSLVEKIKHFSIPIICKFKTDAKGFLFEIALASHLCYVSDNVTFDIVDKEEIKLQIGQANAKKLDLIKKEIDAKTALDLGIINGVVNLQNLDGEVQDIAKKITQLAPIAIKSCLEAVNKGNEMGLKEGLEIEMSLFSQIFSTEDMKEGIRAFLEKRKPIFKGE